MKKLISKNKEDKENWGVEVNKPIKTSKKE